MGMMPIIVSHFTQKYGKTNHKTLIQIKVKVLEKIRMEKVQATKGQPLNQLKATQHHEGRFA
jgi:hypothetical protein